MYHVIVTGQTQTGMFRRQAQVLGTGLLPGPPRKSVISPSCSSDAVRILWMQVRMQQTGRPARDASYLCFWVYSHVAADAELPTQWASIAAVRDPVCRYTMPYRIPTLPAKMADA